MAPFRVGTDPENGSSEASGNRVPATQPSTGHEQRTVKREDEGDDVHVDSFVHLGSATNLGVKKEVLPFGTTAFQTLGPLFDHASRETGKLKVDAGGVQDGSSEMVEGTLQARAAEFRDLYTQAGWDLPLVAGPSSEAQHQRLQRELATLQEDASARSFKKQDIKGESRLSASYSLDELKTMIPEGSLQCPVCPRTFHRGSSLCHHLKSHMAKEGKHKCLNCSTYASDSENLLRSHVCKYHHNHYVPLVQKDMTCPQCGRKMARRHLGRYLAAHDQQNRKFAYALCSHYVGGNAKSPKSPYAETTS